MPKLSIINVDSAFCIEDLQQTSKTTATHTISNATTMNSYTSKDITTIIYFSTDKF